MADEHDRAPSDTTRPDPAAGAEPAPRANGQPAPPPPEAPRPADQIAPGPPPPVPGAKPQAAPGKAKESPPEVKDGLREVVETIVFVVVLVLLLKGFLAEAFVIPTGSMATTLYGYHREVDCPKCKFRFPINMSSEYDAEQGPKDRVIGAVCPNCFFLFHLPEVEAAPPPRR
jgi:hypothetical protein